MNKKERTLDYSCFVRKNIFSPTGSCLHHQQIPQADKSFVCLHLCLHFISLKGKKRNVFVCLRTLSIRAERESLCLCVICVCLCCCV